MSKQHVQLPNDMIKENGLMPRDLLVYSVIKKYMNNKTKECFPSLSTISKDSGYSINTVRKSIDLLKENDYISIRKEGRKNIYKFNPHKYFEPFSYEFLDLDLAPDEKAYILASQQFLIKDTQGFGKTSYTNDELSEKLNISTWVISKLDKSLVEKGYLDIVKTDKKDLNTGIYINEKFFHLDELGQSIIWTLQKHSEDIQELKETAHSNSKDLKIVLKENKEIKQREEQRDKQMEILIETLKNNGISIPNLLEDPNIIDL